MIANTYTISVEDGRVLRVVEAGQPDGVPVLIQSGTPGARLLYGPWVEDAEARGIRLISYDRPGYGGSTPCPGRSVAQSAEDVARLAEALGIDRLLVWGYSGGGPHALACPARLPALVVAAASLASPAPYQAEGLNWLAGMGEDNLEEFGAAAKGRDALEQFVEAATPGLLSTDAAALFEAFRSLLSPVDGAIFTQDIAAYLTTLLHEGIRARRDGWIDDDLAFMTPWGFELDQIQAPVLLMHGAQDRFVPFSHGQWLANRVKGVDARLFPGDGHLSLAFGRFPEVHTWLLEKMLPAMR